MVGEPVVSSDGLVLATSNNTTFFPRPFRGVLTATTAATATIEDPGFGLQKTPSFGVLYNAAAAPTAAFVFSGTVGGTPDVSILQSSVQA